MKKAFLLLIPVFLFGCAADFSEERRACIEQKGVWKSWSNDRKGDPSCNLPTADVGKECTDSSQCESYCWVADPQPEIGAEAIGKCYKFQKAICMREVKEGVVQEQWCQ